MRRERFAGGAHSRASVASLTLGDRLILPRGAKQDCNYIQLCCNTQNRRREQQTLRWGRAFARLGGLAHARRYLYLTARRERLSFWGYRETRIEFVLGLLQDLQLYCKYFQFSCNTKKQEE